MIKLVDNKDLLTYLQSNTDIHNGFDFSYPDEIYLEPEIIVTVSLNDLYAFVQHLQSENVE